MEKLKYITGGGVECPQCGSHNITGGDMDWDEPLSRPVDCNECGAKWVDILRPVDIEMPNGDEIKPILFPLHQIFDWKWIVVFHDGTLLGIHGPFVADKLEEAAQRLRSSHMKMARMPDLYEIRMTPEGGQLFAVAMDDTCVECGNAFDDNDGKKICKTCQDS